jgi:hypothetical protein
VVLEQWIVTTQDGTLPLCTWAEKIRTVGLPGTTWSSCRTGRCGLVRRPRGTQREGAVGVKEPPGQRQGGRKPGRQQGSERLPQWRDGASGLLPDKVKIDTVDFGLEGVFQFPLWGCWGWNRGVPWGVVPSVVWQLRMGGAGPEHCEWAVDSVRETYALVAMTRFCTC